MKEHWEKIEKDNEDIMKRMIPGYLIGFTVIAGCIFKIYMGW